MSETARNKREILSLTTMGGMIKMHNKKYSIWKTRYAENSKNIFEDWVCRNGESILFSTERGAIELNHSQ